MLGALEEVLTYVQESSNKFEVCDGEAKRSGRGAHPPLVQGAPFCRMVSEVVCSSRPKALGELRLERSKSSQLGDFSWANRPIPKQATKLKEDPPRNTQVLPAWKPGVNRLISKIGHLRFGMGLLGLRCIYSSMKFAISGPR